MNFFQTLHRGTTVLYLDLETHQVAAVFLKLERCSGTITWCRPPWKDPRKGLTAELTSSYTLDTVETAVSPGLRLKYTNRSGESLAYQVSNLLTLVAKSTIFCLYFDQFMISKEKFKMTF